MDGMALVTQYAMNAFQRYKSDAVIAIEGGVVTTQHTNALIRNYK